MPWQVILIVIAASLAVLLISGVWTAISLLGAGILAISLEGGSLGLQGLGVVAYNSNNNFLLSAVPIFILLGQLLTVSGVSGRFFSGLSIMLRRVPGGLLPGSILACGVFAATTGTSVATAAAVGSVALPEMTNRGYDKTFSAGVIAAGGTLGILMPPSVALIVYSSLENVSIVKLFAAGLLPAALMAFCFIAYVMIRVKLSPGLIVDTQEGLGASSRLSTALFGTVPVLVLIGLVLGSIYGGVATPSESAALGAFGALLLSARGLTWHGVAQALRRTVQISVMVFSILLGGQVLSFAITNGGVAQAFNNWVTSHQFTSIEIFGATCLVYVLLGDFVEGVGMMVITMPFLFPIFIAHHFNPVLLGVMVAILIELGQITPPVGLNLFILRGIAPDLRQGRLVKTTLPYVGIMLIVLVVIYAVPNIVLWLPSHVAG